VFTILCMYNIIYYFLQKTAATNVTNSIRFVDICENISSGRSIYDPIPNSKVEILLEIIQIKCFASNVYITTIPFTITLTIQYVHHRFVLCQYVNKLLGT